jgi:hypothetical protein
MTLKPPALLPVLVLVACGNVKNDELPDAGLPSDAMVGAPDGSELPRCLAPATYGTPSLGDQVASHSGDVYSVGGSIVPDADVFQLQLYAGFGVFADGVVPGIYEIAGAETQFATCGVCAFVAAELAPETTFEDPDRIYMARAGTVEITSLTPTLSGSVSNLVLDHVRIDMGTDSIVVGDCQTTIERLVFSATVVEQ